jgi:hypothetical protein
MRVQPSQRPTAAGPPFVAALVAVIAAGAGASFGTYLVFGPILGRAESLVVSAVAGGWLVRFVLGVMGYEITTTAGMTALLAGAAVSYGVARLLLVQRAHDAPFVLPTAGLTAALPSLLLSAWIVQHAATTRARR